MARAGDKPKNFKIKESEQNIPKVEYVPEKNPQKEKLINQLDDLNYKISEKDSVVYIICSKNSYDKAKQDMLECIQRSRYVGSYGITTVSQVSSNDVQIYGDPREDL